MLGNNLSITNIIDLLLTVLLFIILFMILMSLNIINGVLNTIKDILSGIEHNIVSSKADISSINKIIPELHDTVKRMERKLNNQEEINNSLSDNQSGSKAYDEETVKNDIANDNCRLMPSICENDEGDTTGGMNGSDSNQNNEDNKEKIFLKPRGGPVSHLFGQAKLVKTESSSMYVCHSDGNSYEGDIDESCFGSFNTYSGYKDNGILAAFEIVDKNGVNLEDNVMRGKYIKAIEVMQTAMLRFNPKDEEYIVTTRGKLKVEVVENR